MKKEVYDKDKLVCVWLSHEDQRDLTVQKKLTQIFEKYRPMKYFVTVFYSGKENLEALLGDLLRYNRTALEKTRWNTI